MLDLAMACAEYSRLGNGQNNFQVSVMQADEVKNMILQHVPDAEILVDGEGCNFKVTVISPGFEGLSLLKKQQMVMTALSEKIGTGELHAVTVNAYTPDEWRQH